MKELNGSGNEAGEGSIHIRIEEAGKEKGPSPGRLSQATQKRTAVMLLIVPSLVFSLISPSLPCPI